MLSKKISIIQLLIILILVLGVWKLGKYLLTSFVSPYNYTQDVNGLRKAVEMQGKLNNRGDESSARIIYRNFLSPKERTMSEDEFVKGYLDFNKGKYLTVVTHDIEVNGSIGYVDRTATYCKDKECKTVENKNRSFKVYEYEDGHWYYRVESVVCPRTSQYEMEPEFSRALSLITQRSLSAKTDSEKVVREDFKRVMNCVRIAYVSSENEMKGAEGVFRFIPGQSSKEMTIYVSPRYKSKDDILTAVLLAHELTHAYNYTISLYNGNTTDCYEDEAMAFTIQNAFIASLNSEERRSILARFNQGGSPELVSIIHAYTQIPKTRGTNYLERALNYVKSHPGYQKQCGSNKQ